LGALLLAHLLAAPLPWSAWATELPCWERILPVHPVDPTQIAKAIKHASELTFPGLDKSFKYFRKNYASAQEVRVMTWNVQHAGPDIFVPKEEHGKLEQRPEWYRTLWDLKLQLLAQTIHLRSPSILFLNEVSHSGIEHLMEAVFRPLGYTHHMFDLEGRGEKSGMGNAFVSKAPFSIFDIQSHGIEIHGVKPETRNIFRVQIRIGNKLVTFLGVHFKSRRKSENLLHVLRNIPGHMIRQQQVIKLLQIIQNERQQGNSVVVLGDLNSPLSKDDLIDPQLMAPERAYQNMESNEHSLWSMTPWFTTGEADQALSLGIGHNPFAGITQPTYIWNDFIKLPLRPGGLKPQYIVNKYRFKFDHVVLYPNPHSLVASANPKIIVTPWHINTYGDPKDSWLEVTEDQLDSRFGPSDHFPVELTLTVQQD
jgi:endonuclease/exonuclease/phosphatase family metal-dependent hydrolase